MRSCEALNRCSLGIFFLRKRVKNYKYRELQALCAGVRSALSGGSVFERIEVRQPAHPPVLELRSTAKWQYCTKCEKVTTRDAVHHLSRDICTCALNPILCSQLLKAPYVTFLLAKKSGLLPSNSEGLLKPSGSSMQVTSTQVLLSW